MKPSIVVISSDEEEEEEEESEEEEDSDYSDESSDDSFSGSHDLPDLSVGECKEYLRKHRLRLSGTKEECLQRIKEHGRLKDGRGELLYPRSSFSINCTGDVCKGDVVLFRQKAHKKQGKIVGKRTVAGRIVNESYGTSKQQHTFTVEVLWSKPFNRNLPPLSALLVKGRNLYRLGTYRQPWRNEAERVKVLGEKHTRGDAARHKRKLRQTEYASNNDRGQKRQKLSNRGDKRKSVKRRDAAPVTKNTTAHSKAQKRKFKTLRQPTNHGAASSSSSIPYDRTSLPSFPPVGLSGYGPYNNGQPRLNVLS
ncbi:zinc finger CCCH domain-containing protein 62-like [Bidens hawaiensis]|uniref:zinc finger CCCH domain-containing protein 62-like n=1 Tax=Bidens hawaiensis TaxID=980011 RepID=UPI00404B5021